MANLDADRLWGNLSEEKKIWNGKGMGKRWLSCWKRSTHSPDRIKFSMVDGLYDSEEK